MKGNLARDLNDLSAAQRTLYRALKIRFGAQLGLRDADLRYLAWRTFVSAPYGAGKNVIRAEECLDFFAIAGAGTVKVTCPDNRRKRVAILQFVGEGQIFGLPALARRVTVRRFGAVAHSPALIGLLAPEALVDVIDRLDTTRRLRLLTYGWNACIGILLEKRRLLSLSVGDRIRYALACLANRFPGAATAEGGLRLTQTDIGQLIGATRSTVNRRLQNLCKADAIVVRNGRYLVRQSVPWVEKSFPPSMRTGGASIADDATRRDVLSCLRQQAARAGLPPAAVAALAQNAALIAYGPGAQIGLPDHSEALSLLITGAARIECPGPTKDPISLLFAKPGWLLLGGTPPAGQTGFRAVAQVESCAAVLSSDGLARVIDAMTSAEFLHFVSFGWHLLSHHLWRTSLFLLMTERDRVLHQLTQLARDFGAPHAFGTIIDLELSVADVARLVGADETRVSRHLRRLRREGRIVYVMEPRKRIMIPALSGTPNLELPMNHGASHEQMHCDHAD